MLVLALAGCTSIKVSPEPVRVEIPVFVKCVKDEPVKPAWSFETRATKASPLSVQVNTLLDEREQRAEYEAQLEAVIAGCK